jgi:hypothetical protein
LNFGVVAHPMKYKPVHNVFKECPEKNTAQKKKTNRQHAKIKSRSRIIGQQNNYGEIHCPDNEWVSFCKIFKILIPENLRLSFIMNFVEFHAFFVSFAATKISDIYFIGLPPVLLIFL